MAGVVTAGGGVRSRPRRVANVNVPHPVAKQQFQLFLGLLAGTMVTNGSPKPRCVDVPTSGFEHASKEPRKVHCSRDGGRSKSRSKRLRLHLPSQSGLA